MISICKKNFKVNVKYSNLNLTKDLNKQFIKGIKVAIKHVKICSITGIEGYTCKTMTYHMLLVRLANIKRLIILRVGKCVKKPAFLFPKGNLLMRVNH